MRSASGITWTAKAQRQQCLLKLVGCDNSTRTRQAESGFSVRHRQGQAKARDSQLTRRPWPGQGSHVEGNSPMKIAS